MKSKLSPWYVMIYQTLAPQTTSNGPIAAHCTISIVSILVTSSLTTRRMSQCLLHHKLFKSSNDFKIPRQVWIPCTHNLSMPPHLTPPTWIPCTHSLTISTHLKHLSPPPLPLPPSSIESPPLIVELRIFPPLRLDKEILNSLHFLIRLITPETKCYSVLTTHPHFFE